MKAKLIQLRNRLALSNRFKIGRGTKFESRANILTTRITSVGENEIVLEEGVRLRDLTIEIRGSGNRLRIAQGAQVSGRIELFGDGNRLEIGERTRINGAFMAAHNGTAIRIGADCLFSMGIDLRTTDSHPIFDETGQRINPDEDIVIADRVWLGLGVSVIKGARIESDTVIGTRALVAGEIPAHCIAAGIPARVVKTGVTWKE